jgi:hypothetical protein
MAGHFDAVGFGDPALGFSATREHLRAAVAEGKLLGAAPSCSYFALETAEGCGLVAATDSAGYLLNGCPYFRGSLRQNVVVSGFEPWDPAEPDQGSLLGQLQPHGERDGLGIAFALPGFGLEAEHARLGRRAFNLVGLAYRAVTYATERRPDDGRPICFVEPASRRRDLAPIRRCNLECRGRIDQARLLVNSRTGARLAYAQLNCGPLRLEIITDVVSLHGGLAVGALLEGSVWLVGRPLEEEPRRR